MKEDIKNIFKGQVDSAESDMDTTALWKAIETKRQPRKKRRFFFLLPTGLVLGGIVYVFLVSLNKSELIITSSDLESNKVTQETSHLIKVQTKEITPAQAVKGQEIHSTNMNNEQQKSKLAAQKTIAQAERKIAPNLQVSNRSQSQLNNDLKTITLEKRAPVQNVIAEPQTQELVINYQPSLQNKKQTQNTLQFDNEAVTLDLLKYIQPLLLRVSGISWAQRDIKNPQEIELVSDPKQQSKNSRKFDLSLVGSISTFNTIYAEELPGTTLSAWQSTLTPFLSVSTDLIIGWNITDRIKIESGLSNSRLSEKMAWSGQYITDTEGNYVAEVDANNPVLSLVGTASSERLFQQVDRNILHYNNYHVVDVPVMLQVKLIDSRLELSPYISTSVNLWSSQSGYILDENLIPLELSQSVKQSIGLKYGGGLELGYASGESISLVSRAQLTTRTLSVRDIRKRITLPELFVGISYGF